jgi:RNA polymerase sigma factor (sigma-70 family)
MTLVTAGIPQDNSPAATPGRPSAVNPADRPPAADGDLLRRLRAGDREAAAEFVRRFGPRLRRRIRSRLGPRMRRIFDSQDILSTLSRRLDAFVQRGQVRVRSERQLWAFLLRMAQNAAIDKQRVIRRLQAVEGEDSPVAIALARRLAGAAAPPESGLDGDNATGEIERALSLLDDPIDREILSMWLAGHAHTVTAEAVGLSAAAVRKRWQSIRATLRESLAPEAGT